MKIFTLLFFVIITLLISCQKSHKDESDQSSASAKKYEAEEKIFREKFKSTGTWVEDNIWQITLTHHSSCGNFHAGVPLQILNPKIQFEDIPVSDADSVNYGIKKSLVWSVSSKTVRRMHADGQWELWHDMEREPYFIHQFILLKSDNGDRWVQKRIMDRGPDVETTELDGNYCSQVVR